MKLSDTQKELASITIALIMLGGCVSAFAAQVVTVVQHDRQFSAKVVNIAAGDTLHFTNEDPFIHQLYTESASFSFNSAEQPTGTVLDVKFPTAGTYQVLCKIHPKMHLTVNVK